jgi:prevent-host-death family protein
MRDIVVNTLPQMAPISDMRNRQNELLQMAEAGPVILLSHSKPAAVLLSPEQWDAIAEALAQTRHPVAVAERLPPIGNGNDHEYEVDAFAEIAALAQPLGPADLSINFDKYTNRVLSDELAE